MIFHIVNTREDANVIVQSWRRAGHRARFFKTHAGAWLACRLA